MRIKVLICAAALAAASAFTSMAQGNVYSLNVVGYINIPLVEGFQLIANQLDYDGTGTNNLDANILGTNVPVGSVVYTWDPKTVAYNVDTLAAVKGSTTVAWSKNNSLNPGQGAWLSIPSGKLVNSNLTTVGQVDQSTTMSLVNPNINPAGGFSLLSSMVPLAGGLTTVLLYTPQPKDVVYQWDIATQSYNISTYAAVKGTSNYAWSPKEPTIAISEGFWLNSTAAASWSNYFTVQ